MNKVVVLARAVIVGTALLPCLAHAQTRLTIYSAYENSQMRPLIQAFEKASPDIKIDHFRQAGEELVAMIELELRAGSPKADVVGLNAASLTYLQGKHRPLLAYAPKGIENVVFATGHAMKGLHLAPATAHLVADLLTGREPKHDLAPFSPDRFRLL